MLCEVTAELKLAAIIYKIVVAGWLVMAIVTQMDPPSLTNKGVSLEKR